MANVSFDETCRVLGIPKEIQRSYEKKGLKSLYEWQVECLNDTGALKGNNVVYCAPTGGGKTLVAELVILKTACALRKKCLFVLPFVSLVLEKHAEIQKLLHIYNRSKPKNERIRVKAFHGESKFSRKLPEDILICTIEKANAVINTLISSGQIFQLGCVVVDEMHVIGDASRGYNLEILISKLQYLQLKAAAVNKQLRIQVVALSATISNLPALAEWFKAILYQTTFRPVPLQENIVSGNFVFNSTNCQQSRPLLSINSVISATSNQQQTKKLISTFSEEMQQILLLCIEGLRNKQQIIIFCTSRNQCQTTAKLLSDILSTVITHMNDTDVEELLERRMCTSDRIHIDKSASLAALDGEFSSKMTDSPESVLRKSILAGVAFHHAGLSSSDRGTVEKAFRKGIINILTATSTLAAGVNLPAGRVIIRSMYFGRDLISTVHYRQMCGRAGRAGLVKFGESYILTRNNVPEREKARMLSTAPIPQIESQMNPWKDNGRSLLKVLLELFSLGVCVNEDEIQLYLEQTLIYAEIRKDALTGRTNQYAEPASAVSPSVTFTQAGLRSEVRELLIFLTLAKAIQLEHHEKNSSTGCGTNGIFRVTRFGRAVMESNMNLDEALVIYDDLLQARSKGISLESNLHLLYLVTPLTHSLVPNFFQLCKVLDNARQSNNCDMLTLFESIGIGPREEATMLKWTQQPPSYHSLHSAVDNLRRFKIERESTRIDIIANTESNGNVPGEFECQLICKCKRLWAASALNMLVECQSPAQVASSYSSDGKQLTIADVESLAHSTTILCCRLVKFCREIGWPDFERLIEHVNTDMLSDGLTKEHYALLEIPGMNAKLAKTLVSNGCCSIHDLVSGQVDVIVQKIQLDLRFEVADAVLFQKALDCIDHDTDSVANESTPENNSDDLSEDTSTSPADVQAMSKDECRRNHLNSFVYALINSARNKLESDEATKSEQTTNFLEGISDDSNSDLDSDYSDQASNGDGDDDSVDMGRGLDDVVSQSNSTQEDDLESSMEEERCGFMYESANWLDTAAIVENFPKNDTYGTGGGALGSARAGRKPNSDNIRLPSQTVASNSASMYEPTENSQKMDAVRNDEPQKEITSCGSVNEEESDITDDAFMMLFDNLESTCVPEVIGKPDDCSLRDDIPIEFQTRGTTQCVMSRMSSKDMRFSNDMNDTNSETPHVVRPVASTPSTPHQSPYLFPFTPSKRSSPGRYLYLPQIDGVLQPNSAQNAIDRYAASLNTNTRNQQPFAWVHMSDMKGCSDFLKKLRGCNCIAFELFYTPIPVASVSSSSSVTHRNQTDHVPISSVIKAWSPLISWRPASCLLPPQFPGGHTDMKNPAEANVLTGVSFSFGDDTGYYMPLPTIPPLLTVPAENPAAFSSLHIDNLPELVQVLICRFVGFDAIFGKCPRLRECLRMNMYQHSQQKARNSYSLSKSKLSTPNARPEATISAPIPAVQHRSNPLLAVSKLWAARARHALRLDWLTGKCIEWRLCNEIMTSEHITKVAVDMKGKLFSLRERDVLVKGYMEDPQLAFTFLGSDQQGVGCGDASSFLLPVPPVVRLPPGELVTPIKISMIKTCHVAVATMRMMAQQEYSLKKAGLFEAFINIEMPLCITVADSERNGLPVQSNFITQLRQDLHDRNKMIEYFCKSYDAGQLSKHTVGFSSSSSINLNFDPSSMKDVHRVKQCLTKILTTQIWDAYESMKCNISEDTAGNFPPRTQNFPDVATRSQWSTGKQEHETMSRNIVPELKESIANMIENIVASHPLLLFVKEYRSHTRLMPLLQAILNCRFRPAGSAPPGRPNLQELDRVRAVFNTLGTETGRLIVTNPPLQQIPHQCVYTKAERVSLLAEMNDARNRGSQAFNQFMSTINRCQPNMREWVRMTSLTSSVANPLDTTSLQSAPKSDTMNGIYSSVGSTVANVSQYSSGKLVGILNQNITQPIECKTSNSVINLFDIWCKAGFSYSKQTALNIPIVVVDIKNYQYFYPADQVVRLLAPLLPCYVEAQALQKASLSISQSTSESQSQRNSQPNHTIADPLSDLLSKKLQGTVINAADYEAFWQQSGDTSTRMELESSSRLEVNPRDGFSASEGYVLMTSDYCQIELRILAHFSLDENLCGAFCDPNSDDIFKCVASRWKGIPVSEISSDERNRVKQLSYALLYGAGPGKVAADAGCSVAQAEVWINQFLDVYPGIKVFMKEVKKSCAKLGYVQTMLGRRRYLPHILHAQRKERSRAERQAVNTVCQGSAADLIKLAMINIHHTLCQHFRDRNYHSRRSVPGGGLYMVLDAVRPVLQIHDELVFEVREEYVNEVAYHVKQCMENAVELNVPLKVKISVGRSFGSLDPFEVIENDSSQIFAGTATSNDLQDLSTLHHSIGGIDSQQRAEDVEYDKRNRRQRRESGNLQPHPLLAMSSSEVLIRTSNKRERNCDDIEGEQAVGVSYQDSHSSKRHHSEKRLPVARCIFDGD